MSRELGLHVGGGRNFARAQAMSLGWDAFLNYSVHTAGFGLEEPSNYALGGGIRATFDGLDANVQPFVRGGLMWQYLVDYVLDDSGLGFYVGAGVRWRVAEQFAISPQLTYTSSSLSDFDLEQFQIGLLLDFLL